MTLKTPRRRISRRTKQRYIALKQFFKKALGSISEIQLNSSITENVTDLRHKISDLEQQVSEVNRQCRDIIQLESHSRHSHTLALESKYEPQTERAKPTQTKLLCNTYRNTDESDYVAQTNHDSDRYRNNDVLAKNKSKLDCRANEYRNTSNHRKFETKTEKTVPACPASNSSLSLSKFNSRFLKEKKSKTNKNNNTHDQSYNKMYQKIQRNYKDFERQNEEGKTKHKNKKTKQKVDEVDHDFIYNIIKRQYRPVKMFDRRESQMSQMSAPVCRDYDHSPEQDLDEGFELCSCCYGGRHHSRSNHRYDYSDTRSMCDARMYTVKRSPRNKYRKTRVNYDDCELYDLIPVKERSSPKSRRKFALENDVYSYYKEVPPSPRSQRPKLNLKAQYSTVSEDQLDFNRYLRHASSKRHEKHEEQSLRGTLHCDRYSDDPHRTVNHSRSQRQIPIQIHQQQQVHNDDIPTTSSLQYNTFHNQNDIDKIPSAHQITDKTDKALCEIKDILQIFLQEIKKEASSQSGKSDVCTKNSDTGERNTPMSSGTTPNSGPSFNNYSIPQCGVIPAPYLPSFPNPCCYPVVPVCPAPFIQNGCVLHNRSTTCETCKKQDEFTNKNETVTSETDELIREIHQFVAQSPIFSRKKDNFRQSTTVNTISTDPKLTSRSAGGSVQVWNHDANVQTPAAKCQTKSCEAIRSRAADPFYSHTNTTYSDTILENISLEATATTKSVCEIEINREFDRGKTGKSKIAQLLQNLKNFKKKKDIIDKPSDRDSSVEMGHIRTPPFEQNVSNYTMFEQDYYRPSSVPQFRSEYAHDQPPYYPGNYHIPHSDPYRHTRMPEPPPHPSYYQAQPSAPPYNYESYHPSMGPHTPLCLKEIEVKSIGTQSERKISLLRKLTKKVQQSGQTRFEEPVPRHTSTQSRAAEDNKQYNWKSSFFQNKAMNQDDPRTFSYKTKKKLAADDTKIRNVMLKKLFYKKNPFSPRNLIVKTLMGKDKTSYGDPPAMFRPRMFM